MAVDGQMSLNELLHYETQTNGPEWKYYIRQSDGKKVKAYKCNDKEWYVIKSLEHDHYWMETSRAFQIGYVLSIGGDTDETM